MIFVDSINNYKGKYNDHDAGIRYNTKWYHRAYAECKIVPYDDGTDQIFCAAKSFAPSSLFVVVIGRWQQWFLTWTKKANY